MSDSGPLRSSRTLRPFVLATSGIETLVWLYIVGQALLGTGSAAKDPGHNVAWGATIVFAISALPALVLGIVNRSLFPAAVLCGLPILAAILYVISA